jgi:hypothetical protein
MFGVQVHLGRHGWSHQSGSRFGGPTCRRSNKQEILIIIQRIVQLNNQHSTNKMND